jgi:hypothetical protein
MGHQAGDAEPVTILVTPDSSISIDVGARFVPVGADELEQILDRVRADGGSLRVLQPGGSDDGDEPFDRDADTGAEAVAYVLGLANARGIEVQVSEDSGW